MADAGPLLFEQGNLAYAPQNQESAGLVVSSGILQLLMEPDGRRWRALYDLGEWQDPAHPNIFADRYAGMNYDEQRAYNDWADRWEWALTERATSERGIRPWGDLLSIYLTNDKGGPAERSAIFQGMTLDERAVFHGWATATASRMELFHAGWVLSGEDGVAAQQNPAQMERYKALSEVDQRHYREWLLYRMAEEPGSTVTSVIPIDTMYTIFGWRTIQPEDTPSS